MATEIVSIFATGDYEAQITRGRQALRAGGLVVLPTETVYGAAGLLTHPEARRRLKEMRGGPESATKPFTIHLPHAADAQRYLGEVGDFGQRLMKKLWPGPVGLVFQVSPERRRQVAAELQ